MAVQTIIRKWGNSVGIILPKEFVENEKLKENDKIVVNIVKESDIDDLFGSLKRRTSGQRFKDLVKEGWE